MALRTYYAILGSDTNKLKFRWNVSLYLLIYLVQFAVSNESRFSVGTAGKRCSVFGVMRRVWSVKVWWRGYYRILLKVMNRFEPIFPCSEINQYIEKSNTSVLHLICPTVRIARSIRGTLEALNAEMWVPYHTIVHPPVSTHCNYRSFASMGHANVKQKCENKKRRTFLRTCYPQTFMQVRKYAGGDEEYLEEDISSMKSQFRSSQHWIFFYST